MLRRLSIRNVVLIDRLDLDFDGGLTGLTGETGAGKSILLDALGLALGLRAEAKLLRSDSDQASVSAEFDVPSDHPARDEVVESGIDAGTDELILRRVLGKDGRTRAFINDQAVSVGLLKRVGEKLTEIHGQFDTQRLLDAGTHRALLDGLGSYGAELHQTADAFERWRTLSAALSAAEEAARMASENEEFLRHAVSELRDLSPQAGEEQDLAAQRKRLQYGEQISQALREASSVLGDDQGVDQRLSRALGLLESVRDNAAGGLDDAIQALERAVAESADASAHIDRAAADLDVDPSALEAAEERLFALRAVARKHGVEVPDLTDLRNRFEAELSDLDSGGENLARLRKETDAAREVFVNTANALSKRRMAAGQALSTAMETELVPLKLGAAKFSVAVEELPEDRWTAHGCDRVSFEIATNPGAAPGPLSKIASGGELARFMLALKVVLAEADPVPVLIFDEVDAGVGGAVAAAVGERLARLAHDVQVFVVTHSPQVAAQSAQHYQVMKRVEDGATLTHVAKLSEEERREEIARMLSGEVVTSEARAAAESLLNGAAA